MEMYTRKEKNALQAVYDHIGQAIDSSLETIRSMLKAGSRGEARVKTEAERDAENRKRCYEARAMAGTWQGPRYYR